ncbi:PREDICTED: claudin-4-like [Poecilia mexicana]|uniref:claudin-4-like n=1 Tax=Poecilia mexicana TaxID=48701 RepID=UPI00072E8B17|nr:PREDICTED: claudin-4-like [Poecilia mexicana]
MASKAAQMVCVTLGVIGLIGVITCCALPQWKVTFFKGANIVTSQCMLGILSLLLLIFGSDFTPCVQNQDTKPKMILAAAVGLLLAGLLVIIPVSWSAHIIIRDFYNPVLISVQKRELGASIFIGWAAGVILILTGVLLCFFGRPRSSSSGGTARYYSKRASGPNDDTI